MPRFDPSAFSRMLGSAVRPVAVQGLKLAGAAIVRDIRRRISVQGPPPSDPFKPPHMDSGRLHESIFYEVDGVNMRVYIIADTEYAIFVEQGTSRMAPRPFMRSGLAGTYQSALSKWVSVAFAAPRMPVDESLMRR